MLINNYFQLKKIFSKIIAAIIKYYFKRQYINNLWVIGGYGVNEIAIINFLKENHLGIIAYLVVKDKSVYQSDPSILKRGSLKAYLITLLAQVVMCTHSLSHNFDLTAKDLKHSFKVQLFHGIIGLRRKNKQAQDRMADYDLLIASSEYEKKIKISWGIDSDKIAITGLPRHDMLLRKHHEYKDYDNHPINVLYMPSWRPWLKNRLRENIKNILLFQQNVEFIRYLAAIKELLNHPKLTDLIKHNKIDVKYFLHVNMQMYYINFRDAFSETKISILPPGTNLQDEIVNNQLLITDYSSVAWEFLLLGKPVIFYQFDLHEYVSRDEGPYIDLCNDLYGPAVYNADNVVKAIEDFVFDRIENDNFDMMRSKMKSLFFAYGDENNSERVVTSILQKLKRDQ